MYVRNYCPGLDIPWQIGFNRRIRKRSKHTVNSTKSLVSGKEKILCGHSKSATRLRFIRTGQEIWFNQAHMFHVSGLDEKTRQILLHLCAEEDFRGMHTTEMENQSRKKHWRIFVKHSKLKAFFSNGNPKICCCWTTC